MLPCLLSLLTYAAAVTAASIPRQRDGHSHSANKRVAGSWYHPRSHPAHELFRRGPSSDEYGFPAVGSPEWSSGFPTNQPASIAKIPKAWKDALDQAVAANKIPNIPPTSVASGTPKYASGYDPMSKDVCSATWKCRLSTDVWDAPDGVFASSFDDGPLPPTSRLLEFLEQHNVTTTHFMIGITMLQNPKEFQEVLDSDNDVAVHTWSHRYTTSLTNEEVVGELGWTIQLIFNSTGHKLPKYWRPPYGDTDARVSAIAREVFGLTTVIWNQDTEDWSIASGGTTADKASASLNQWIGGPKSPGLMPLEHELTDTTVDVFMKAFPLIQSSGWKFASFAEAADGSEFQDEANNNFVQLFGSAASSSSSSSSATSTASAASKSASPESNSSQPASGGSNASAQSNSSSRSASRSTRLVSCLGLLLLTVFSTSLQ